VLLQGWGMRNTVFCAGLRALWFGLVVVLARAEAASLYAFSQGSDSNSGTSAQPFRIVTNAYSRASGGTTIRVLPGPVPITAEAGAHHAGANQHGHPGASFLTLTVNTLDAAGRRLPLGVCVGAGNRWPTACWQRCMSAPVYTMNRKGSDYIKATLVPSNHSEEPRFDLVDGVVTSFLLLCVSGLVYFLALM
jgi:hypothetical protein